MHGDRLTLKRLEKYGIIARVLELQLDNKEINVAAFVRLNLLEPDSPKKLEQSIANSKRRSLLFQSYHNKISLTISFYISSFLRMIKLIN